MPAGAPIYIATEDRLCALFGLCVGAPVMYTFFTGNQYYVTVFRPNRAGVDETAALQAQITTKLAGQRAENYEVFPGIGYRALINAYNGTIEGRGLYKAALAELMGRLVASMNTLAGLIGNRQTGRFTPLFRDVFTVYAVILEFVSSVPSPKNLEKSVASLDAPVTAANYMRMKRRYMHFWDTVSAFKAAFPEGTFVGATIDDKVASAVRAVLTRADAVVAKAAPFSDFDLEKPFYETSYINLLQNFQTYLTDPIGEFPNPRAPLEGFLEAILAQLQMDLAGTEEPKIRRRLRPMIMNCRVFLYLMVDDVSELPPETIPSLKAFLKSIRGKAAPAKGFALSRLFAKMIRRSVDNKDRERAITEFMRTYGQVGGARTVAMMRKKAGLAPIRKSVAPALFKKQKNRTLSLEAPSSGSRTRSRVRAFTTPGREAAPIEYSMRAPFLVLDAYVAMLGELLPDVSGPRADAIATLLFYLGPLLSPAACSAFWAGFTEEMRKTLPAFPDIGEPGPFHQYLYYEAIVDILTMVMPLEGPSDMAELTTTLNTLLFGAPRLSRPDSIQAQTFSQVFTRMVMQFRSAMKDSLPTIESVYACLDEYESQLMPLPVVSSAKVSRASLRRLAKSLRSITRASKSRLRYVAASHQKAAATRRKTRARQGLSAIAEGSSLNEL